MALLRVGDISGCITVCVVRNKYITGKHSEIMDYNRLLGVDMHGMSEEAVRANDYASTWRSTV